MQTLPTTATYVVLRRHIEICTRRAPSVNKAFIARAYVCVCACVCLCMCMCMCLCLCLYLCLCMSVYVYVCVCNKNYCRCFSIPPSFGRSPPIATCHQREKRKMMESRRDSDRGRQQVVETLAHTTDGRHTACERADRHVGTFGLLSSTISEYVLVFVVVVVKCSIEEESVRVCGYPQ